ncbi:MAG: DUF262 domain-containing protein [Proteobacteria bacterium]|nr:DUF262 domain-containing protein [Pseudomonadota bacterium]MBS0573113.1 DUF262 domain-containing protein [Pseudomonadota bacterium]
MANTDELVTINERDDEAYVEFDIASYPSDYTLEGLCSMLAKEEIIVPEYQRKYVWTIEQASKLIESFLMGLPVPQIFLYVNDESIFEVIDGQQRLRSVSYFMEGFYGEADTHEKRRIFKLTGLAQKSPYRNKRFVDLDDRTQRQLRTRVLRAINIKQLSPKEENTSVYHIFERLNTGGTHLKPQEIRNAVFRGDIVKKLTELNHTPGWHEILGIKGPEKSQKDIELILRLFSLFKSWENYEKPMKEHLNKFMKANRAFDTERAAEFAERFPLVVQRVIEGLGGKPFRPKRVVNAAILEAVMVALLENRNIGTEDLRAKYPKLLNEDDFKKSTTGATTDTKVLQDRIKIAASILGG